MHNQVLIKQLQSEIDKQLSNYINRDYYLLEVPYYTNIGDTLIWQGELNFLKKFPFKCKGQYSLETFPWKTINKNSLILFQGGGNFGDLWPKHHLFKMKVMAEYPNCLYLFFPQTVFYENEENLKKDALFFRSFPNATICVRDKKSFSILKKFFCNKILLVPDMAFYMDMNKWNKKYPTINPLLLKRVDKEINNSPKLIEIETIPNIYVTDWLTMNDSNDYMTKIMRLLRDNIYLKRLHMADWFAYHFYRKHLIHSGIKLINSHTHIYATRLHAAILSVLLEKEVTILDNSYGKNHDFYNAWLKECELVNIL